jgi:hypothetical protein
MYLPGCLHIIPIQKIQSEIFIGSGGYDTLAISIADYFNEINYRYKIKTIDDIKEWGKIVRKFYEEYAVPFFEKYNSVDTIDKLCNTVPTKRIVYCDDLFWKMMNGLISAKLNDNPKYNDLRNYYKSEVERIYQVHFKLDKSLQVINFLDRYTSEELNKLAEEI